MSVSVHYRIKELIEQTREAFEIFSSSDHVNSDYAEFAAMSLEEFRAALGMPELTDAQLIKMLRKGRNKYRKGTSRDRWPMFLAGYVTNKANGNAKTMKARDSWVGR